MPVRSLAPLFLPLAAVCQEPQQPPPAQAPAAAPQRIEWQRTLADALAVQQATGLPLLIAVNMDGEVFNEAFAKQVYHDPAFVASTRGYVCVVASPDRHTERDYDAFGNRVECPRFPGCTCSEHIAIEPELFARFFGGTRNAPRHVGVSKDGKVLFDRFLDHSMQTAIDAIGKHRGAAAAQPAPSSDVAALLARRDALARRTLEAKWRTGDAAARRALLAAAATATNEPVDLLRAALRVDDDALFQLAATALAATATPAMVIDVEDALARTAGTAPAIESALVARLATLGATDKAAARLAAHFAPAAAGGAAPVGAPWTNAWAEPRFQAADRPSIETELDGCEAALRANASDDETRLQFACAQLALAELLASEAARGTQLWFDDTTANAKKLQRPELAAEAAALLACTSWAAGDADATARALAAAMAKRATDRKPSPFLAARVLDVAVQHAAAAVFADVKGAAERNLRAEVDRVGALLDALARHGATSDGAAVAGAGVLELAGLRARARAVLAATAAAQPGSVKVHEHWRARLLIDLGAEGLRAAYAAWAKGVTDQPLAQWFAGLAAIVAAEQHVRDQRAVDARAAYDDAIERFGASASGNASFADSANHYAVLALAGRAELRAAAKDHTGACGDLLRAAELRPESLDTDDGLARKPRAIAGRVARLLEQAGEHELAAKLKPILP
jgi:hypothetical protein